MNRHLCEAERLTLITEAVCYCQRVKAMGMPATAYTKALREPIYFLWECRDALTKEQRPKYRSRQSLGIRFGGGSLVYDHAVPFRYLQEEPLALCAPCTDSVGNILNRHGVVVLITEQEDRLLRKAGYGSRMPEGWDGLDPFARHEAVGIELVPNPEHPVECGSARSS